MSTAETISPIKIAAEIAEIELQRNSALTRSARLAGDNAELLDLVKILRAEVERLEAVVKRQSALIPDEIDRNGATDLDAGPQA